MRGSSTLTKVTVHKIRLYDATKDDMVISRRMATPEGAARMGGEVIEGTDFVIDLSELEAGMPWTKRDFDPASASYKRQKN